MIFALEKVINIHFSNSRKSSLIRILSDRKYDCPTKQEILNKINNNEYYKIDNSVYYSHIEDKEFVFTPDFEMEGSYIGYLIQGNEAKITLAELLLESIKNKYSVVA